MFDARTPAGLTLYGLTRKAECIEDGVALRYGKPRILQIGQAHLSRVAAPLGNVQLIHLAVGYLDPSSILVILPGTRRLFSRATSC